MEKYGIIFRKVTSKATSYTLEEVPFWIKHTRLHFLAEEYNFKYIFVSVYKYFDLPKLLKASSDPVHM